MQSLLIMLRVFDIAGSVATYPARVELWGVLGSVVNWNSSAQGHDANVFGQVVLTREVVHVLLITDRILLILFTSLLNSAQLRSRQSSDLTENDRERSIFSLDCHATQLLMHLGNDSLGPSPDLIVDKLYVILSLVKALQFLLQHLLLIHKACIILFLRLLVIYWVHKCSQLIFVTINRRLLVFLGLLGDLTPVFVCNRKLLNLLLLLLIHHPQFVVLLLILTDSE